jgi:hypothetical protein
MENDLLDAPVTGISVRQRTAPDAERLKLLEYALNLFTTGFSEDQITTKLVNRGCTPEDASEIVAEIRLARAQIAKIQPARNGNPARDVIIGGLFLFGGLIGTFSDTGYIFIGAIVFGGIQFVRGLINLGKG